MYKREHNGAEPPSTPELIQAMDFDKTGHAARLDVLRLGSHDHSKRL
jgi:hypothetical protein